MCTQCSADMAIGQLHVFMGTGDARQGPHNIKSMQIACQADAVRDGYC